MKVLLINGSPNEAGCTFTALSEAARILEEEGIETEMFQLGKKPIRGAIVWAEEVEQDLEGMQIMRTLGRNMAWMLKCIEVGKKAGIDAPEAETPVKTNFIR